MPDCTTHNSHRYLVYYMCMGFDRFDICDAYWMFYSLWHSGGLTKRCHRQGRGIAVQLSRIGYHPGMGQGFESMSGNALDIYIDLVKTYHPGERDDEVDAIRKRILVEDSPLSREEVEAIDLWE